MVAPAPSTQLALPGFEAVGIEQKDIPEGVSDLSSRELKFVQAYLRHGQVRRAAVDAGYKAETAHVSGSRLLKKAKVAAFLRKCVNRAGQNATALVGRVFERSTMLHAKATEAGQEVQELEDLVLRMTRDEDGETPTGQVDKTVQEYETRRDKMVRLEKHYMTLANQTDTLLGSLLGKLQVNLNINPADGKSWAEVLLDGQPLNSYVLEGMAQSRREFDLSQMGRMN